MWNTLMAIENKIVAGEVDSLGGVMHLPLHWVLSGNSNGGVTIQSDQEGILNLKVFFSR